MREQIKATVEQIAEQGRQAEQMVHLLGVIERHRDPSKTSHALLDGVDMAVTDALHALRAASSQLLECITVEMTDLATPLARTEAPAPYVPCPEFPLATNG